MQSLTVLGSTGSIGVSTLDVVAQHPERFTVFALTADSNVDRMLRQINQFEPEYAVMRDGEAAAVLRERLSTQKEINTQVLQGEAALCEVAEATAVDTVVAAIVGAAGLPATYAAVCQGKRVLLANKESLVMAGALFMQAVARHRAHLLPVDSEHNAIFQCLPQPFTNLRDAGVRRLLLTGSGGPFRETPLHRLAEMTPEQACAHPNWSMGPKISVDSATMMNKGLEFIEACWLFGARPDEIDVIIHPQSIIHSMVEYTDGSVIAQMGQPDMRTPIAYCLGWPQRIESQVRGLNFYEMGQLDFSAPDFRRFPCLKLALEAMREGGTAPTAVNAANEVVVGAFLSGRVPFTDIAVVVDRVMQNWNSREPENMDAVILADQRAREMAEALIDEAGSSAISPY